MIAELPTLSRTASMAKKAGRPKKAAGERRDKPRPVVFSRDELKLLDKAVKECGVKKAAFMREAVMKEVRRVLGD
jgi:hypothetical protein